MTIRLYLDEDALDRDLVRALRTHGVDVLTAQEAGLIERPDEDHLAWATSEGRVLYSFNIGHFYRLHTDHLREGRFHAGMILARQQAYSVGEQARRLLKLIAAKSAEEMRDHAEFLSAWTASAP